MSEKKNKKIEGTLNNEETKNVKDRLFVLTQDVVQSIDVLIQCANLAQKAGLLTLQDAAYANQAVLVLGQYLPQIQPTQIEEPKLEEALKENNEENK